MLFNVIKIMLFRRYDKNPVISPDPKKPYESKCTYNPAAIVHDNQITSGTLSYMMGCGRPAITIPFVHAKEIVNPKRGILVELGNPKSFSKPIMRLLLDESLRESMGENAYEFTRHMTWDNVANSYLKVFEGCLK